MAPPTRRSRDAIARAWYFLEKAEACPGDAQVDFEAFLEASIVFARAAVHRFRARHRKHPDFQPWWDWLRTDASADFFRKERDWLLKEAPPKIGQVVFLGTASGDSPPYAPAHAFEHYYFETAVPATDTVRRHLAALEATLDQAEKRFAATP